MKTIEDVINELANTLITKNNAYGDAVAAIDAGVDELV